VTGVRAARARLVAVAVAVALVAACSMLGSARAATAEQQITIYAVPETAQFMNHADDRVRGMTVNPFTINVKALQVVVDTNGKEKGNGPFPGDDVLYTFGLFTNSSFTKSAGSAMFTCYYGFDKSAICDTYFDLPSGLVLASGQVPFGSSRFTLGISGGTTTYLGVRGELRVAPATKNALRLDLVLLGR